MTQSMREIMEKMAEEYAGVAYGGTTKNGDRIYCVPKENERNLHGCREKIEHFKEGFTAAHDLMSDRVAELMKLLEKSREEFGYRKLDFELVHEGKGWNHSSIPRCQMMIDEIIEALNPANKGES